MQQVLKILKKVGAIIENDHFIGTSGLHFDTYINKDYLFLHTRETSKIGKLFAEKYKNKKIDVVVAPALGGIILSQWTAHHLSKITCKEVLSVFTEKNQNKDQIFTRGYDKFVKNKNVLVVEDVITTGGSVLKTINAVKEVGGRVIDTCVMVNKGNKKNFSSLADYPVRLYKKETCPMCKQKMPVNTLMGHGKKII